MGQPQLRTAEVQRARAAFVLWLRAARPLERALLRCLRHRLRSPDRSCAVVLAGFNVALSEDSVAELPLLHYFASICECRAGAAGKSRLVISVCKL